MPGTSGSTVRDLLEHLERYDVEHAAFSHKSDFDRFRQRRFVEQVTAYQPEAIADFEAILEPGCGTSAPPKPFPHQRGR